MAEVPLAADPDAPAVAMAFKLVEEPFGQVTYMRVYQGTLKKGTFYYNARQRRKTRISRILRVHADQREDIDSAGAGDIVAVMGLECAVGAPEVSYRETPTRTTPFNYKHRKQTGGAGQYAHIIGVMEPLPPDAPEPFVFEDRVTGGRIPNEYIPSVEKGFRRALQKG